MMPDMMLASGAVLIGLLLLIWSADKFVDGAAATAAYAGMPPLLIGMIIIGFGTSAPEMVVSALAAIDGQPALALGNAYGSNIGNIALILGITAILSPIRVQPQIFRRELPILIGLTLLSGALLLDNFLGRLDAGILLGVFFAVMGWSIRSGLQQNTPPEDNVPATPDLSLKMAIFWLILGLVLLVVASRTLVWGAVSIAQYLGVSELIIGLTIVAIGTSLPELASSIAAIKKGEHDLALGNVIGSNIFNTLAVVGIAAGIKPLAINPLVLHRDWVIMMGLTLLLTAMCYSKTDAKISRFKGVVLCSLFLAYITYLVYGEVMQHGA